MNRRAGSLPHILSQPLSVVIAFLLLSLADNAAAHTLPLSFLRLVPDADYLHLELTFNPFELAFFSELDANKDGRLDSSEWEAQPSNATRRIMDCLKVSVNGKPVAAEVAGIIPDFDSHHATLRAHYAVDARHGAVTVVSRLAALTSGSHFTQVTFSREGGAQSARLDAQSATATFGKTTETGASSGRLVNRSANNFVHAARASHFARASSEPGARAGAPFPPARETFFVAGSLLTALLALGALLGLAWLVRRGTPRLRRTVQSASEKSALGSTVCQATGIELRNIPTVSETALLPLFPSEGGEGRGEDGRLHWVSPRPSPLSARASQREGEDQALSAGRLNSTAVGNQPVPSGDSPGGTGGTSHVRPDAGFPFEAVPIPVGESPTGAGGSPAPPGFLTRSQAPTHPPVIKSRRTS